MPHPVDIHVGKRLRLRRTILGMSQETIGKAVGITFQQVQKYERGVNRMGSSRLFELSKLLTVPVSYFFDDAERQTHNGIPGVAEDAPVLEHEKIASRETLEMMRAYYRIQDVQVRKRVFELVKSLAEDKAIETE